LGSKNGKSWVVGIPADVVKELQISASTIFVLRIQKEYRKITLQKIDEIIENYGNMIPADESLVASKQQVSKIQ
jgi:antitoxin component of MazEF toxin-antitoxin module